MKTHIKCQSNVIKKFALQVKFETMFTFEFPIIRQKFIDDKQKNALIIAEVKRFHFFGFAHTIL